MSSYAEAAKRIAVPPPVAEETQRKKQKTELPPPAATNKEKGPWQTSAGAANKKKKGNNGPAAWKQKPQQQQQQQQNNGKHQGQPKNQQKKQQPPQRQQQQQQPNDNNNATNDKKKAKSRKPTLKTMSFADVLPGDIAKGQGKKGQKPPQQQHAKNSTHHHHQPQQQQQQQQQQQVHNNNAQKPPQLSEFPSLASSSQSTAPSWPLATPPTAILKRGPAQSMPGAPAATGSKATPAPKPPSSFKPTKTPSTLTAGDVPPKRAKKQPEQQQQQPPQKMNVNPQSKRKNYPPVPEQKSKLEKDAKSSLAASLLGARPERVLDEMGGEHDLLRLMSQGKVVVQTKGRQRVRPRKKKFSSLKKKVLEERLRQWKEKHDDGGEQSVESGPASAAAKPCSLCLYGFAEAELVEDDDEYQELRSNLADMAQKISTKTRVAIPRHVSGRSSTNYPCFVEFETWHLVEAAISCWDGLSIGGETLRATAIAAPKGILDESEWEARCLEVELSSKESPTEMEIDDDSPCGVILDNIITEDDLEDDECLEETLNDIREICRSIGDIGDLVVDKEKRSVTVSYLGGATVAQKAVAELGDRVMGGAHIKARLASSILFHEDPKVILHQILTEDDLEDEDCLEETVNDIRRVAEEFGVVKSIQVDRDERRIVLIYEGGTETAKAAVESLGTKAVGGALIQATLQISPPSTAEPSSWSVILKGALTEDDLEDEECLEESLGDLKELASKYGHVIAIRAEEGNVRVEYKEPKDIAFTAKTAFNGMVIGGQTIEASLDEDADSMHIGKPAMGNPLPIPSSATAGKGSEPLFSGEKRIPERFAECLRAPKVVVATGPRKYATLLNDDTVKPLIIEMLGELMRLQKRAIDDKNAKARRRLVMGFREVTRGVRARKVKLVIMANNLDDQYGAIDDKLQEILDLCHKEGIPVLFELNKKGIGKALGKTIKVAVVGVQNADGANAQFKKLLKLAQ